MRFSVWELLLIAVIVVVVFGTKKVRSLGADLGAAIKGFRSALSEADKDVQKEALDENAHKSSQLIDGEVVTKKDASEKA